VDVNAVEQWTRDTFLVFRHNSRRASTRLLRIAMIAAGAGLYTIEVFVLIFLLSECHAPKTNVGDNDSRFFSAIFSMINYQN
jgi:uncharacterized RDD family membrane protein YckC